MKKNKMRKLFAVVMAVAMVMACNVSAFAGTIYQGNETNRNDNGLGTAVVFSGSDVYAEYSIFVPEKLIIQDSAAPNLWTEGKEKAKLGIRGISTMPIRIIPAPKFYMYSEHGEERLMAQTVFDGIRLSPCPYTEVAISTEISAVWETVVPLVDTWNGTLTYEVILEEPVVPESEAEDGTN